MTESTVKKQMNKHEVLGEIKGFLEGYNSEIKYLVNVETDSRTDIAECIIHEPGQKPRIEKIRYQPFVHMKDLKKHGIELYPGKDEEYIKSKQIKYGITITKLKTGNQQRLVDGYCYKVTSHRSSNDINQYFKDGGFDRFEKLYDENGRIVRDDKDKIVYKNRDFFHSVHTNEQFFISTQSRLYKGYEQYKEVHRVTADIETEGLRYQIHRMFAIGVRDNRGFETILEVDKRDDDESEIKLIQDFFNLIHYLSPAVLLGHNWEDFDMEFILGRAKILGMDLTQLPTGLKDGVHISRKGGTSVKYGNNSDKYTATKMWGISIIDSLHAAKRTQAVNTDIKKTNLKYIAKFEHFAKENRTYIKGEDNDIGRFYNENKVFLCNEKNEYIEIPDEFQDVGEKLIKLQANKHKLTEDQHKELKKKYLDETKTFIPWFKANCIEKNLIIFIRGRKLVKQYLLDDLYETSQVDELYNQSSFMVAKIVPTTYQRICTMGTAAVWNLLLTAWSYENDLAIPIPDKYLGFSGGLARTFKKGYTEKIIKIDYASLYPMIQLTDKVFPMFDITGVMEKMLLYMTTTRNIYKKMGVGDKLDKEEVELLEQLDPEVHQKYISDTLSSEDTAMFKIKQLPIKILNNSLYGALGSHISFNWSDNICAGRITCIARLQLRHAIYWFSKFGCVALLAVTDGINFQIPDMTKIIVRDEGTTEGATEGAIDDMWQYNGKTGISALIELFNDTEMPKPYMSVDDDGKSESCLNLARINYATLSLVKDKKTGGMKEKIKLTGNTIKSKAMPEYIEEFIDKGLDLLLHGKGKEFVDYYYDYAENIRYMQIPLKKIASKSRVKLKINAYKKRGTDKNGRPKAMQAHMELLIKRREEQAVELFELHKDKVEYDKEKEDMLSPDEKMKLIVNYMPQEPELDDVVYYVNTGYVKSHGESKEIKDKETGEMRMASALISNEDLQENPEMTGTYNYEKYLAAFNSKVKSILVGFDPAIAKKMLVSTIKKGDKKGDLKKEMFTSDQLVLKSFDLDDFDEAMQLEDAEIDYWNKTGYDPRLVWDGFSPREDYPIYYEIYEGALNHLNVKMAELGKPPIKSINDDYGAGDLVLIKNGSQYDVGAYNGVFLQIIRENVEVPKSEVELELDRIEKEKQDSIDALKASELAEKEKSDRIIYLEAQEKKRAKYFEEFKRVFKLNPEFTPEVLFSEVEEAQGAFDTFVESMENATEDAVAELYGLNEDGDGPY